MGKEISHIILADQAAAPLERSGKDPLLSVLRDHAPAYKFGSIAADTFFYGLRLPFLEKPFACCGDKIHGAEGNDTSLPILRMLHELKNAPHDPDYAERLAFTCGLLTHIALDTVIHPFVYYLSGNYHHQCPFERGRSVTRHRLIESWLDLLVLGRASLTVEKCGFLEEIRDNSKIRNIQLLRFFFDAVAGTVQVEPYLWKYLIRGYSVQMRLNSLYPNRFWGGVFASANRALKGRLDSFTALFYPGGIRQVPPEIACCDYYRHPVTGEEMGCGFDELWEDALCRSLEFLEAVHAYLYGDGDGERLGRVIKGYSLSMGMVGVPASSAGYFDALPMERIRTI